MNLDLAFSFVNVVEKRGFSAAARALGVPKSRLSRQVRQLEQTLETRLLHRDSRHMSLTEAGEAYFRHAKAALECMVAAEAAVRRRKDVLEGSVTLSCSVGVAQFAVSQVLPRFMAANPRVLVRLQASNEFTDLIEGAVDIAIRGHLKLLPDSAMVQRRLAVVAWRLFASPDYVERFGAPHSPEDLDGHAGLAVGWRPGGDCWSLQSDDGASASVPYAPRLRSDDMVTLMEAAAHGLGVAALPAYVCREAVEKGRLERLLPAWTAGAPELSLLMPSRRGNPPQVDAMVTFLRAELPTVL